jgi:hypothetical protein
MNLPTLTPPTTVVRRAPFARRSQRRALVLVWALCCLGALALALWAVTGIIWFVLFAVLVVTDLMLVTATHRVADFATRGLDEREQAVRDRAFRTAYLLLAGTSVAALSVSLLLLLTGTTVETAWVAHARQQVALLSSMGLVVLQLLCLLPTALVAWSAPDDPGEAG